MLKTDIEIVNNYLADLSHYNRRVAESWYRVRDFADRIIDVAEEKINSTQQLKAEIAALLEKYETSSGVQIVPPSLNYLVTELRRLSAV